MRPPTRYTYHYDSTTREWYVYDNLRDTVTHKGLTAWGAADTARVQEKAWRMRCDRQQKAEHRGDTTH